MTNREINALVAEKVFDLEVFNFHNEVGIWRVRINGEAILLPRYSSDLTDAWKVVDELKKSCDLSIVVYSDDVRVDWVDGHLYADTAPMAICLAALKANGVDIEANEKAAHSAK